LRQGRWSAPAKTVRVGSPAHRGPEGVVLVVVATEVVVGSVTGTVVLVVAIDVEVGRVTGTVVLVLLAIDVEVDVTRTVVLVLAIDVEVGSVTGTVVLELLTADVEVDVGLTGTVVLTLVVDVVGTVGVAGRAGPSTWQVLTHSPATTFRGPQPSQADALVSKKQGTVWPPLVMAHACSQTAGSPSN
jgi:hypothetical protein